MNIAKKLWDLIFPPPPPREVIFVSYREADELLKKNEGWRLAREEDQNDIIGRVYLERDVKLERDVPVIKCAHPGCDSPTDIEPFCVRHYMMDQRR